MRSGNGHVWWQSVSSFMVWKKIIYALFLYNLVATLLFTIFKEFKQKKNIFFVTIAVIFHKRPGWATISLKVDHVCIISIKFRGNWLYTGFWNMLFDCNYLFFCNSDGHVGWQSEVFNQNFERRPHMHSFHMVWLHLILYRILK